MNVRKFRPDIEVLRAIAVVAVVLAHSKLTLPGGFIGVDIFFVISGFLITKHIFDEAISTGSISLSKFYSRRILRILPLSTFVVVATLLASYFWLSIVQYINYAWDATFAGFSGINYRLAIAGTDYFNSTSVSPFQHFWSLAVEEQFYFIWPILILILAKMFLRDKKEQFYEAEYYEEQSLPSTSYSQSQIPNTQTNQGHTSNLHGLHSDKGHQELAELKTVDDLPLPFDIKFAKKTAKFDSLKPKPEFTTKSIARFQIGTTFVLLLIIGFSLYLSYTITAQSQPWAYFGLHTRAWQLAIGALVSFWVGSLARISKVFASLLSWFGFSGLVLSFWLITESTPYPGLWALLPTISTALIIVAGINQTKFSFESVFSSKVTAWIGKISYSWYLVHWPIFVITFYALGEKLDLVSKLLILIGSFVIANGTYFLIENPIRFNKSLKSSVSETFVFGLILILIGVGAGGTAIHVRGLWIEKEESSREYVKTVLNETQIISKVKEASSLESLPNQLLGTLDSLKTEKSNACLLSENTISVELDSKCNLLGLKSASKSIVLLGDQKAGQWIGALDQLASQNGFRLVSFTKTNCPLQEIKTINPITKSDYKDCYAWREKVFQELAKVQPEMIVVSNSNYEGSTPEIYKNYLQKLQGLSKEIVHLAPTPTPVVNIPECLSKHQKEVQKCTFNFSNSQISIAESKVAKDLKIKTIDTQKWFCQGQTELQNEAQIEKKICPGVIDENIVYDATGLVSGSYSTYLSDTINLKLFKNDSYIKEQIRLATKIEKLPTNLPVTVTNAPKDYLFECKDDWLEVVPSEKNKCILGNKNSKKTIVLLGDSHAQQWIKPLESFALKYDYRIVTFTKASCTLTDINMFDDFLKREYPECNSWRNEAISQAEQLKPQVIITSEEIYNASSAIKFEQYMQKLKTISPTIIRLMDNPRSPSDTPECLSKNQMDIQKCSFDQKIGTFNPDQKVNESTISKKLGITEINTEGWFCLENICPAIINNIIVYIDTNHITKTYALYLTEVLEDKLVEAIGE